jgi:organic hydroperoxide reductase OsmC/OhrA
MLWYLHLCADAGVRVLAYEDRPTGILSESGMLAGELTVVALYPRVEVKRESEVETARALHEQAHALCFLARSVRTPIRIEPLVVVRPSM